MTIKILLVGENVRMHRRIATILESLSGVTVSKRVDMNDIECFLADHRFDALLLEMTANFEHDIARLHRIVPKLPIVVYEHNPDHLRTKAAFLAGARDCLALHSLSINDMSDMLERVLNPTNSGSLTENQIISSIRFIAQRGESFVNALIAGAPPAFYMNGNRTTLLRANVVCIHPTTLWRQEAVWSWIQEFRAGNSFLFESSSNELRLAAMVEQDYVNAASFKRMLDTQLDRFYTQLGALGCVCVATHCSADYLNIAMLHRLDNIADLVFYMDESQTILDSAKRHSSALPVQLFDEFCSAVALRNASSAIACVDRAVANLRNHLPAPSFARANLGRFVWNLISVIGCHSEQYTLSALDDSHIRTLRDAIVSMIRFTMSSEVIVQNVSPLDELIHRIESNPGLPINIDQAAEETNFSRSHFCRLFRQQTGQSFNEFLTQKRIAMAADLLRKTSMRIEEVSGIVGISNTWYFKKLFQKEVGIPIEEWLVQNSDRDISSL